MQVRGLDRLTSVCLRYLLCFFVNFLWLWLFCRSCPKKVEKVERGEDQKLFEKLTYDPEDDDQVFEEEDEIQLLLEIEADTEDEDEEEEEEEDWEDVVFHDAFE